MGPFNHSRHELLWRRAYLVPQWRHSRLAFNDSTCKDGTKFKAKARYEYIITKDI
jgi:hypothetical protein